MRFVMALFAAGGLLTCADTNPISTVCDGGTYKCVGNMSLRCAPDGSGWQVDADCVAQGKTCTSRGCLTCEPTSTQCRGQDLVQCNDDGTGYIPKPIKSCDASQGLTCDGDGCVNACALALRNRSYVGCEYWPVDLDNAVVEIGNAAQQQYALALSNPSSLTAEVKVLINEAPYGAPAQVKEWTKRTVAPQALEVILLPPREVDGSPPDEFNTGAGTAITANAYKIESNAPLILYQFNPLSNVGVFSNDASLLVPTPALSSDATATRGAPYIVMGWPQTIATTGDPKTNFGEDLRAFLTIVGTRDGTAVRVYLSTDIIGETPPGDGSWDCAWSRPVFTCTGNPSTPPAGDNGWTCASSDGKWVCTKSPVNPSAGPVLARKRGETLDVKLNAFDVLNLETGGFGADADFTGTRVEADKPVAVYSGSEASDVPDFPDLTTRKCCADHLEEQLHPVTTLGNTFIAIVTSGRTQAVKGAGGNITPLAEPDFFRLLSAGEIAAVTTNLPPPDDQIMIAGGKFAQIRASQSFVIQSTEPLVVGQFMPSQDVTGIPSSLPGGDPSFILLPPVEQFRKDYLFLTPDKYAFDFIAVAAPQGAKVTLDGRPLKDGQIAGPGRKIVCSKSMVGAVKRAGAAMATVYEAYKCQLCFPVLLPGKTPPDNLLPGEQNDGVHRLQADQPVGLVVYGFDAYVSYGYPGGTDLALINLK